jgi:hypothetical protein
LGDSREGDHLEDQGIDGKGIEKDVQELGWRGMDWIAVSQALVNAVINLQVP